MLKNSIKASSLKGQKIKLASSLFFIAMGVFLLPKVAYLSTITPDKIIELTNRERIKAGLNQLTENNLLTEAANEKAKSILSTGNFAHTINDERFSSWIKKTGYQYTFVGENLAMDFMTSEGIMIAWLNSKAHKDNLINSEFKEIGVAVVEGKFKDENTIIVVQTFGAPVASVIASPEISGAESLFSIPKSVYGMENFKTESLLTELNGAEQLQNFYYNSLEFKIDNLSDARDNVNTFFAQQNFMNYFYSFSIIIPYLFLCLLLYLYFFYFSYFKIRIV